MLQVEDYEIFTSANDSNHKYLRIDYFFTDLSGVGTIELDLDKLYDFASDDLKEYKVSFEWFLENTLDNTYVGLFLGDYFLTISRKYYKS